MFDWEIYLSWGVQVLHQQIRLSSFTYRRAYRPLHRKLLPVAGLALWVQWPKTDPFSQPKIYYLFIILRIFWSKTLFLTEIIGVHHGQSFSQPKCLSCAYQSIIIKFKQSVTEIFIWFSSKFVTILNKNDKELLERPPKRKMKYLDIKFRSITFAWYCISHVNLFSK